MESGRSELTRMLAREGTLARIAVFQTMVAVLSQHATERVSADSDNRRTWKDIFDLLADVEWELTRLQNRVADDNREPEGR